MNKDRDILQLKGIGEKTAELYHKVGIYTYGDLMYYYPRDYIKYDEPCKIDEDNLNKLCFFEASVVSRPLLRRAKRLAVVSADLRAGDRIIKSVWFHMPYLTKSLIPNTSYIFCGVVTAARNSLKVEQPLVFTIEQYNKIKNTLQPVYPLTKGLTNNALRKVIHNVLDEYKKSEKIIENSEGLLLDDMNEATALMNIHFPHSKELLKRAREYLVYDEFFMFILRLRFLREENSKASNSFKIYKSNNVEKIINSLPYKLTNAQLKVIEEIENDLTSNHSCSRLVQGDVGCGKTIVAILSCVTVCESGYQSAVMVPTEILAKQHYESFVSLIKKYNLNINVSLLTGSMKVSEKKKIYNDIENNNTNIIIGTHALIQESVIYNNLGLVVTDEQHRFGVKQREKLVSKNIDSVPHVLVMSATPIPRTLAIIMYGDLDVSVIDEVPARRVPIKNCVVNTSYRKKAYEFIEKEVSNGHQAYVICPLVEESEGLECKDVISYTDELSSNLSDSIRVEYLHGKMKAKEKEAIMNSFLKNEINVLVSTTVIEVGVNVPNSTVMLIENAEKFGLAQLHQLRGRIGRGDLQSYCIFINGNENENSKRRLEILNKSNDGFFIASEDLKLRGPGDMFGIRQSGDMHFNLGDIYTDAAILKKAADKVDELLKEDRYLEKECNRKLKMKLDNYMKTFNQYSM